MLSALPTVSAVPTESTTEFPVGPAASSPDGIGDIVMAGARSPYAHLVVRSLPTVGRRVPAARAAAAVLARPETWPRTHGRWRRAPRAARRRTRGRMRMSVVVLHPNGFVALPPARPEGGPARGDVLLVVHGRIHAVVTGRDGRLLAVQELVRGRTRVLGGVDGRQLVNTGTETALVVRVTT